MHSVDDSHTSFSELVIQLVDVSGELLATEGCFTLGWVVGGQHFPKFNCKYIDLVVEPLKLQSVCVKSDTPISHTLFT